MKAHQLLTIYLFLGNLLELSSFGTQQIGLAVLPLSNLSSTPEYDHWGQTIPLLLKAKLRSVGPFRIPADRSVDFVPDSSIEFAFHEAGLTPKYNSEVTPEQARNVAEILETRFVLWGTYRRDKHEWVLTLRCLDAATGTVSELLTIASDDWSQIVNQIANCVIAHFHVRVGHKDQERLAIPVTRFRDALELLSRAFNRRTCGAPLTEVEELLRRATSLDPNFSVAQHGLAYILALESNDAQALVNARRAVAIDPNSPSAHYVLGVAALNNGFNSLARDELRLAEQLDSHDPYIKVKLAELFCAEEDFRAGVKLLDKAAELAPYESLIHADAAAAHIRLGHRLDCMKQLRLAERYDMQTDSGNYLRLAETYTLLGDIPDAIRNYGMFLHGAEQVGLHSPLVEEQKVVFHDLQARLERKFVPTPHIQELTAKEIEIALRSSLTPNQRAALQSPFVCSPAMITWAKEQIGHSVDAMENAERLFSVVTADILLRHPRISDSRQNCLEADQVFARCSDKSASLSCQDLTLLYSAVARTIGLKAYCVLVQRDYRGEPTCHLCAGVLLGDKTILVDPAYQWFGVVHKAYQFLDDLELQALVLSQSPDLEKARLAAKLAPHLQIVRFNVAISLAEHGFTLDARKALGGIEAKSDQWLRLYAQSVIEWHEHDLLHAEHHLKECLDANPNYSAARFTLARVLSMEGKKVDSVREYHLYLDGETVKQEAILARQAVAAMSEEIPIPK